METTWDVITTTIGDGLAVFTDSGLAAFDLLDDDPERALGRLQRRHDVDIRHDPGAGSALREQVDEYLAGHRREFDLALDWSLTTGFTLEVLQEITLIPYAQTVTYGDIARRTGRPLAFRAVGAACRNSPFAVVVPVHRVVHADGTPGGYAQRPTLKAELLEFERSMVVDALPADART